MSVSTSRKGAVTVVTIERPRVKNAIDGATAAALVEAFEADGSSAVAVLTGRALGAAEGRGGRAALLSEGLEGAARFAAGAGRHGSSV